MEEYAAFYFEEVVVRYWVDVVSCVGAGFIFSNLSVVATWRG
jgi:hypothetical protein